MQLLDYGLLLILSIYVAICMRAIYGQVNGRDRIVSLHSAKSFSTHYLHQLFLALSAIFVVIKLLAVGAAAFMVDSELSKALFPVLGYIEIKNAINHNREVMACISQDQYDVVISSSRILLLDLIIVVAYLSYLIVGLLWKLGLLQ